MSRHPSVDDDRGATLILVLVIITVFGLILGAALSLGDTSIRATLALRDQAATQYNADGAVQTAVTRIRNSSYNGTSGSCFGSSNQLQVPYGPTSSAVINCVTDPTRVRIQCTALSSCNRPGNAILTLGNVPGEDGINIAQPTGSAFRVHGIIFSNSTNTGGANGSSINVVNGSLNTNTAVYARGACSGTITSTPVKSCNYTSTDPRGDDPNYVPDVASPPPYRSIPACTTPNSVVTFLPGYYDDAKGLSDMMGGNSTCKGSTWWFKPGTYYFDFHNSGTGSNPVLPATTNGNAWNVNDGCLIAGTPSTANGVPSACAPIGSAADPIPGSCVNPIDTPAAVGVQFIFGNDSQFAVKAGQAEICGTYNLNKPPVAIYGLKSGSESTTALTGANVLKLTGSQPAGSFANAANVADADTSSTSLPCVPANTCATWSHAGASNQNPQTGTLTTNGYAPPSIIPAGSNLGSALSSSALLLVHGDSAGANTDSRTATITPLGADGVAGAAIQMAIPSYSDGLLHSDAVDLSGNSAFAQFVHSKGFSGAKISYSATFKHSGTASVDALQLRITYTPPAFRAGSGCVTNGPYTGTGSATTCALVTSVNNSGNQLYVQGTTYAPRAALDITLNNSAEQVFRFGVISRTLWVKLTGSFSYSGVVIEVPDDSPGFVFGVYLDAWVCPSSATCSSSGSPLLKAKVAFVDADPANPTPGNRQVVVLSWSSSR